MAWIKIEVPQRRPITGMSPHVCVEAYRIVCRSCGHDDFKTTRDEAQARAYDMSRDHIPYSPDGSLSCLDWSDGAPGDFLEGRHP